MSEGGRIIQETRSWDDARGVTLSMRNKEQAEDYRYFPEPDLVPIVVDPAWIEEIRAGLPELPDARKERIMSAHGLSAYDAAVITATRPMADYFDALIAAGAEAKAAANWLMGEVSKKRCMQPSWSGVTHHAGTAGSKSRYRGNLEFMARLVVLISFSIAA